MILLPTYSGVFDIEKKTAIVFFDGEKIKYVSERFQPVKEIFFKDLKIDFYDEFEMKNFLKSLEEFNVILYTEDILKINELIQNNIFGFRLQQYAIGTTINNHWDIKEWYEYIKSISSGTYGKYFNDLKPSLPIHSLIIDLNPIYNHKKILEEILKILFTHLKNKLQEIKK